MIIERVGHRKPGLLWAWSTMLPPAHRIPQVGHAMYHSSEPGNPIILPTFSPLDGHHPFRSSSFWRITSWIFTMDSMYSETTPFPMEPGTPHSQNTWGVNMGYGTRKHPRYEDAVTFDDNEPNYRVFPNMTIEYALTERENVEIAKATERLRRAGKALGVFVTEPRLMPNGSSLHYQGTMRMRETDDGTSVADAWSRVWGYDNLVVGGNALIRRRRR